MVVSVLEFSVCSDVGSVLLTDCNVSAMKMQLISPFLTP